MDDYVLSKALHYKFPELKMEDVWDEKIRLETEVLNEAVRDFQNSEKELWNSIEENLDNVEIIQ